MGLDFIRRGAKGFAKAWDKGRTSLAEPTLFTRYPEARARTVIAELLPDCKTKVGAQLAVCVRGDQLVLVEETNQIGCMKSPPPDLLAAVRSAGGYAFGQIKQIHPLSGTADVEID